MAYTKIHAIKATVNKAIKYIINPNKTDGKILVDSFGSSIEGAALEFDYELSKTLSDSPNKTFHLIQSFMPGEVFYDEAHQIGIEIADRLLENKYSYVISTHIDHDHIHNHIIFCAANNIDHRKHDDNKRSYHHIRNLSDELCAEHNLSIINPGQNRGMKYNEWTTKKEGASWKAQLKRDIDECIKASNSYEHFIELIKAKGYEVKGEKFVEASVKYISFRPLDRMNFVRGSDRSLGKGYTKEKIRDRIDETIKGRQKKVAFPKKNPLKAPPKNLIDTSTETMQSSPGLRRWANIQNLKAAAHAYAITGGIESLEASIAEKDAIVKASKQSMVALEKKMKPAAEIIHYAKIYKDSLRFHNNLKRSKDPDRYYRNHDSQLQLFNSAEHVLKDIYHINPEKMDYNHMEESFALMQDKKETLTSTWKSTEKEITKLKNELANLKKYLGSGAAVVATDQTQDKDKDAPVQDGQTRKNSQDL